MAKSQLKGPAQMKKFLKAKAKFVRDQVKAFDKKKKK